MSLSWLKSRKSKAAEAPTKGGERQEPDSKRLGMIVLVDKAPNAKGLIDIVALHGLGGHPLNTWTWTSPKGGSGESVNWLEHLLPKEIDNARIMSYGYDSDVFSKSTAGINQFAEGLLEALKAYRASQEQKERPIVFVCHSLGGIVFKQALIRAHERDRYADLLKKIRGVAFFGTPHTGSSLGDFGNILVSISNVSTLGMKTNTKLVTNLTKNSETLWKITRSSVDRTKMLEIVSFYETGKMDYLPGALAVVVPEQSAVLNLPNENQVPVTGNHRTICKFSKMEQDQRRFAVVKFNLKEMVDTVLKNPLEDQRQHAQTTVVISQPSEPEIDRRWRQHLCCPDSRRVKEELKKSKDKLLSESFEWIIEDQRYKNWRDGEELCVLWISGGAGKGKTMISIGLVEELLRFCEDKPFAITYFFCQKTNPELNTLAGMIKGLILQLINQQPALKECLRRRWDPTKEKFVEDVTSWRELWNILLEMTAHPDFRRLYLVVDSLDECQDGDMEDFLKSLVRNGLGSPSKIKWLFTSRPLDNAEIALPMEYGKVQIVLELEPNHLSRAVKAYVAHKARELSRKQGYERHLRERLESQLLEQSRNTFLWVSLVCKELEDVGPDQALGTIQKTPQGLDPLYGQALERLRNGHMNKVRSCLRLLKTMLLAYRPLKLIEVVSIAGLVEEEDVNLISTITRSASFLRIQGESLEFVHQSARDYVAGQDAQLILDSHETFGNHEIAHNCILSLTRSLKANLINLQPDSSTNGDEFRKKKGESALLVRIEYAALFWGEHLRHTGDIFDDRGNSVKSSIIVFLRTKLLEWLECLSILEKLSVGVRTLRFLEILFKKLLKDESRRLPFVVDCIKFLMRHYMTIDSWPLQAYISAIIWSPKSSFVRQMNLKLQRVPWLRSVAPLDTTWGPLIRTLGFEGFAADIGPRPVIVSPDNRQIACSFENFREKLKFIEVFDIATGISRGKLHLKYHPENMAFSQDSKQILWISRPYKSYKRLGGSTDAVFSWSSTSGELQSMPINLPHMNSDLRSPSPIVALSVVNMQIISILTTGQVRVWDMKNGKLLNEFPLNRPNDEFDFLIAADSKQILLKLKGRPLKVLVWDTTSGKQKELQSNRRPQADARDLLAYSAVGEKLVFSSSEGGLLLWETASGRVMKLEAGPLDRFLKSDSAVLSPDGKRLAVTYDYSCVTIVWDAVTGMILEKLVSSVACHEKLAFSPSGSLMVSVSQAGLVEVWDMEHNSQDQLEESGPPKDPMAVALSPNGKDFVCCFASTGNQSEDFRAKKIVATIRDVATGTIQKEKIMGATSIESGSSWEDKLAAARFSPDGSKIAFGSRDGVIIWDLATDGLQTLLTAKGRSRPSDQIAFSPNGKYLVSCIRFSPNEINTWNTQSAAHEKRVKQLCQEGENIGYIKHLCFSSNNMDVATVSQKPEQDTFLRIWNISQSYFGNFYGSGIACKGEMNLRSSKNLSMQDILKFSADGQHLLTTSGPKPTSDTSSEPNKTNNPTPSPYLHLDGDHWVCCGRRRFLKLPMGIEVEIPLPQDMQADKLVIGLFGLRGFISLDIDVSRLSSMLESGQLI